MRGKSCAYKRKTAWYFTTLTAQGSTVRDVAFKQMDVAFNQFENAQTSISPGQIVLRLSLILFSPVVVSVKYEF